MSKHTEKEVQDIIGEFNYTFLRWTSGSGQKRKVVSLCPNGEEYSFYLDHFTRLNRRCTCEKCTGKNKWTYEKIIDKCKEANVEYLGHNNEDNRKIDIRCVNGNITSPHLGGFIKKPHCSCENCGGFVNWTEERIRQEIEPEGYTYISHYIKKPNNRTKVNSLCPSGNDYLIDIVNFHDKRKRRCQCEDCTGVIKWTDERIKSNVEEAGHTYLGFEIKDRYEKHIIMKCKNGNITDSIIPNLETRKWACSCDDCTGRLSYTKENITAELEKYDYSYMTHYIDDTSGVRVKAICPKGNVYDCKFSHFINGSRCDCCKSKSKAESKIMIEYDNFNIPYIHEFTFDDCVYTNKLKFDIVVFTNQDKDKILFICELDGIQHTKPIKFSNSVTDEEAQIAYELTVIRDNIKNEYCKNNNIPLVRVPHTVKLRNIYNYIEVKLLEDHGINLRDFFNLHENTQQAS